MNDKKVFKLQIIEFILKIFLILSVLLWIYQLYLSILSYNDSFSAPWYVDILYRTIVYIGAVIIVTMLYVLIRIIRKNHTNQKLKINFIQLYKKYPLRFISIMLSFVLLIFIGVIVFIQPIILYHPNHSQYAQEQLIDLNMYKTYDINDGKLSYHGFGKVDESKNFQPLFILGEMVNLLHSHFINIIVLVFLIILKVSNLL